MSARRSARKLSSQERVILERHNQLKEIFGAKKAEAEARQGELKELVHTRQSLLNEIKAKSEAKQRKASMS